MKTSFENVMSDITSKFYKIKQSDYLSQGKYSIIDQGADFIAGYTDDDNLVNMTDFPVIIFGDHTKIIKYIDFPIALGADGVKVLQTKSKDQFTKFIYYYLKSIKLPDAGYSRHFKYLKEYKIPLPPLQEQIRIADILSRIESLIAKRKESIRLLDDLVKSVFLDMFGDPVRNEKGWQKKKLGDLIWIKHGFAFQGEYFTNEGNYVLLTPGNFYEEGGYRERGDRQRYYTGEIPNDYILSKGDLLIAMTEQAPGLLGSAIIVPESNKFLHNQRLGLIVFKTDKIQQLYLYNLFNFQSIRQLIHNKATGTKVRHTSPTRVEDIDFYLPPIELQDKFASVVVKVEATKVKYRESLLELEALYGSLSQRAFRGAL